jgi:glycerophosphoryl diester phosphodiesterase
MLILAHRGAHGAAPANTVAAFRAAGAAGADGVELDVRATVEGRLVVHHDPHLPDGRLIAGTEAAALPPWVPTLEAALAACAGLALVDVEIKSSPVEPGYDPTHAIAAAVAAELRGRGDVLVSSFDLATLDAVRRADPDLPTGWLTMPGYDQLAAVATVAGTGHAAINPPDVAVAPPLVEAAHATGLRVVVWTVNEPARMAELAAMGVDVLVTDRPELAGSASP